MGVQLEARLAQIAEARAEKRGRGTTAGNRLNLKVSTKGVLSLYGLQRMPVTLYVEQWLRLLAIAEEIRQFAKEHDGQLEVQDGGGRGVGASLVAGGAGQQRDEVPTSAQGVLSCPSRCRPIGRGRISICPTCLPKPASALPVGVPC